MLTAAGLDDARRRARRLLAAALRTSPTEIFAHPEIPVDPAAQARVAEMLRRVVAHEPLSRIIGAREFWGLEFVLSADTLDPRPETETIVEAILARLPQRDRPYRLLDLGTGSGCLLMSLLSELPRATGIGIDIAPGAAYTARHNAVRLGFAARAQFLVGSWADAIIGQFDAIVANPPYIPTQIIADLAPEVREYDPHRALDGGPDGLVPYRAIAKELPRMLTDEGLFAAELGLGQAEAVTALVARDDVRIEGVVPDLAGIRRCIVARRRPRIETAGCGVG